MGFLKENGEKIESKENEGYEGKVLFTKEVETTFKINLKFHIFITVFFRRKVLDNFEFKSASSI